MGRFSISFHVSTSKKIDAKPAVVREKVKTFEQQDIWSPWLVMERSAKSWVDGTDGEVGAVSNRDGDRLGSGNQRIDMIVENKAFETTLQFLKPWNSKSTAGVYLEEDGDGTLVTWKMDGSLPWFLFWMKSMMVKMIGKDYMRGLVMLKDIVETGSCDTETNYEGEAQLPEMLGIGIANKGHESVIGDLMKEDYSTLESFVKMKNIEVKGGFGLYPKVDMKTDMFEVVSCLAVDPSGKDAVELPEGMERYTVPQTKALKVVHKGDYKYISNSWTAIYGAIMNKKGKANKKIPPVENYIVGPRTTDVAKDRVTEIYVPIK